MTVADRRHLRRLNALFNMAQDIECVGSARVTSAVFIKNDLISIGFNQYKTDPWAHRYRHREEAECLHAEIHAIKQAIRIVGGADELIKARTTLYVSRARKLKVHPNNHKKYKWVPGIARPCSGCGQACKDFKIDRIVYTMNNIVPDILFDVECHKTIDGREFAF